MGILSRLFGGGGDLPDILCNTEEGFYDMTFAIVGTAQDADGRWHFHARAQHESVVVGFEVVLGSDWREGAIELGEGQKLTTYTGAVEYRSTGDESDKLAETFVRLYGIDGVRRMKSQTRFTAISLEGNPLEVESAAMKIKLFFEPEDEDAEKYAEVFTNIAYTGRVLEVREKDPEYRAALVRAMTK